MRAWAESLQDSKIKGQRYLTEKVRRATQAARDRKGFLQKLQQIREEHKQKNGGERPWTPDLTFRQDVRAICNLKPQICFG